MGVNLIGVRAFKQNLATFVKGIPVADAEALDAGADIIVNEAKKECPVGTPRSTGIPGYVGGSLKKSIRKEKVVRDGYVTRISVRVGGYVVNPNTNRLVDYHIYVHEGTSRMPGRPFLTNAIEKNELRILDAHANLVRSRLW